MSSKKQSIAAKAYLTTYNAVQAASWSFILLKCLLDVTKQKSNDRIFKDVEWGLGVAQTAAFLEVVHCITGIVRSNPFLTFVQILSRVVVYWGILIAVPESRAQLGFLMLLIAWCIAEITRYLFYALSLYDACPRLLTWCRYSFFILLYPTGVSGELLTIYSALPFIKKKSLFTLALPNPWNISFDYHLFMIIVMLTYLPGFPQMYGHMLKQRAKVLCSLSATKEKAA